MSWNRFDICEAWWAYAFGHHRGQASKEYKILGRLRLMGFKARISVLFDLDLALTPNGKEIFDNLVSGAYIREV